VPAVIGTIAAWSCPCIARQFMLISTYWTCVKSNDGFIGAAFAGPRLFMLPHAAYPDSWRSSIADKSSPLVGSPSHVTSLCNLHIWRPAFAATDLVFELALGGYL